MNYGCGYCGHHLIVPEGRRPTKCRCGKEETFLDLDDSRERQRYEAMRDKELNNQIRTHSSSL